MVRGLTPIVAVAALAISAQAGGFSDNFESYAAGSDLHNQGGWRGWDGSAAAGALVSNAYAYDGVNSVNITGGSDLVHEFTGFTSGKYTLSVAQYIPSASTGDTYFILMNKYKENGAQADYNWSVQTHHNMDTGVITSDMGGATAALVKDQWVVNQFLIDLDAGTVAEYYNGQKLADYVWQTTGVNQLAAIDLYANNAGPVYYDSLTIEPGFNLIPEPAPLALLTLGALALVLRRRVS